MSGAGAGGFVGSTQAVGVVRKTQVSLSDDLFGWLERTAVEQDRSRSSVVRRALERERYGVYPARWEWVAFDSRTWHVGVEESELGEWRAICGRYGEAKPGSDGLPYCSGCRRELDALGRGADAKEPGE